MSTALYRKYRPDTFDNIIGQSQVIDVLKNQIKENKISHAYIFSGTRGTGKTSTAKVFARAINCINYDEEKGPCNECESCTNNYVDTVEIDAASNNSVDDVRQLKDTIMYQPTFGKYKTYIIDEVHMLSTSAFNALLKTLEEPPSHVVFILATTEMQKIPATILSRCQKFEFKKVSTDNIKSRLLQILNAENIDYDDEAVDYISASCDGGLRDAISMLDQVSSFGKISMENIDFVTGQSSIKDIDDIIKNIIDKKSFECIQIVDKLLKSSVDIKKIPFQIISRLVEYIYIQNESSRADIKNTENIKNILSKDAEIDLSELITDFSELENNMKYSPSPEILFQAFVIKCCRHSTSSNSQDILPLIKRIEELENKIQEFEKNGIKTLSNDNNYLDEWENDTEKSNFSNTEKAVSKPKLEDIKIEDELDEEEKKNVEFVKSLKNDINSFLKDKKKANLTALLFEGEIRRYIADCIYISFARTHSFHKTMLENETNLSFVKKAFAQILKKEVDIFLVFDDEIIDVKDKKEDVVDKIEKIFGKNVKIEVID